MVGAGVVNPHAVTGTPMSTNLFFISLQLLLTCSWALGVDFVRQKICAGIFEVDDNDGRFEIRRVSSCGLDGGMVKLTVA